MWMTPRHGNDAHTQMSHDDDDDDDDNDDHDDDDDQVAALQDPPLRRGGEAVARPHETGDRWQVFSRSTLRAL